LYRDYFFDAAIAVLIVFILTTGRKVSSKSIQYYIIEQRLDFVCYKPFVRTSRKKRKEPDAINDPSVRSVILSFSRKSHA